MWNLIGLLASLALAAVAWRRSIRPAGNIFERDVYGMSPRTHRAYAATGLGFAVLFTVGIVWGAVPAVPILAIFAVIAILYASSFVRGASGEDE